MNIQIKKSLALIAVCLMGTLVANAEMTPIATEKAPKAIGPYSQAICTDSYVFVSGQIAIDPISGKLTGETIGEQTRQVIKNLEAVLAARGLTLENVVKTEVYLKDMKDFAEMNRIYAEHFSYPAKPARATIQVSKLPMDALVEISCIAYIPERL